MSSTENGILEVRKVRKTASGRREAWRWVVYCDGKELPSFIPGESAHEAGWYRKTEAQDQLAWEKGKRLGVTKKQWSHMRHACGLDRYQPARNRFFRNRYCTNADDAEWPALVDLGLAKLCSAEKTTRFYSVSERGLSMLRGDLSVVSGAEPWFVAEWRTMFKKKPDFTMDEIYGNSLAADAARRCLVWLGEGPPSGALKKETADV